MRTEKIQNIPNRALGNLMEAATKACFKNRSAASMIPSDTNKCVVANTLREIVSDVFPVPAPSSMAWVESFLPNLISREPICINLVLCPSVLRMLDRFSFWVALESELFPFFDWNRILGQGCRFLDEERAKGEKRGVTKGVAMEVQTTWLWFCGTTHHSLIHLRLMKRIGLRDFVWTRDKVLSIKRWATFVSSPTCTEFSFFRVLYFS